MPLVHAFEAEAGKALVTERKTLLLRFPVCQANLSVMNFRYAGNHFMTPKPKLSRHLAMMLHLLCSLSVRLQGR